MTGIRCALAAAIITALSFPAVASGAIGCETRPGTGGALLLVRASSVDDKTMLLRTRQTVGVYEAQEERRIPCEGPAPTVTSIDRIRIRGGSLLLVDLLGGPFEPGASVEPTGRSEIEIFGNAVNTVVAGTSAADAFGFGSIASPGGDIGAVNLNLSEPEPDADLFVGRSSDTSATGRGGNDFLITARGDPRFRAAAYQGHVLEGGGGNDRLIGGSLDDALVGGRGKDRLTGSIGQDDLFGGSGPDAMSGGAGADRLVSRDHSVDRLDCGPGNDRSITDPLDRLRRCERGGRQL